MSELVNRDAERSVVSSLLDNPDRMAEVVDRLPVEAFGDPICRTIYRAMRRLWDRKEPPTLVTIPVEIQAFGGKDLDRWAGEILSLRASVDLVEAMYPGVHADVVLEYKRRRDGEAWVSDFLRLLHEREPEWEAELGKLRERIEAFRPAAVGGDDSMAGLMDGLQERSMRIWSGEDRQSVTPTGIAMLDRMLNGGIRPKEMIVLAGRPGMGKTQMMLRMAQPQRRRALVVSLEMSAEELGNRMACGLAEVPYAVAVSEIGDLADRQKFLDATETIKSWPVILTETERTTAAIGRRIEEEQQRGGISAVFIDHMDWLEDFDNAPRKPSDYERTSALSRRCKQLAKTLDVPVVVLSQLNREVEGRAGCLPYLSDLRDSGKVEQDANIIILLYRRAYYSSRQMGGLKPGPDDTIAGRGDWERLTASVAKNRNGMTGFVDLGFDPHTMRLHDVESRFERSAA